MTLQPSNTSRELRLIRIKDLPYKVGLSVTEIETRVRKRTFPAPYRLSPNVVAWRSDELDDWIYSQPRR
jgi:predicted DNA-binding transcriptional regulator AlpA